MKKTIREFCEAYKAKSFMNNKQGLEARIEWIKKELGVKEYVPFMEKKKIAEIVVAQNIKIVDGIKKYDSIGAYIGLVVSSIMAHTDLEFSSNPIDDYDMLSECGLLPQIVAMFQESHNEIDILHKMALAMELEDNQPGALIGRFLDRVLKKLDDASGVLSGFIGNLDLEKILTEENAAKIVGLLNK